jgi:hypothetical protein
VHTKVKLTASELRGIEFERIFPHIVSTSIDVGFYFLLFFFNTKNSFDLRRKSASCYLEVVGVGVEGVVGVEVELPSGGGGIDASEKWERELVT